MQKKDDTNDKMIISVDRHGNIAIWGTRKNWDKLMKLGKELGLPDDDMLHAYDVSLKTAETCGTPTDFDLILDDVKSGLAFHFEVLNVANEISVEFDIDPQEAYEMMLRSMMEDEVLMQLYNARELPNDVTVAKTAGDIVRKWINLKIQF
jgi:hypothetical protein